MPSPDLLPRGRSFPSAVPPPLPDVLTGARRRRMRQGALAGVVAAAAVVATTLAFVPLGTSDSLHSVTPTLPGHPTSPSPAAHGPTTGIVHRVPSQTNAQSGAHRQAMHVLRATKQHASDVGTTRRVPPGSRDRGTTVQGTTVGGTVGPPHRTITFDATKGCTGTGPTPTEGWCSYYLGPSAATAGHGVTLATAVCRLPGQAAGTLKSRTGRQANFDVGKQAYRPLWKWSHGRTFSASSTSIRVAAGTCVEWYVSWRVVDNSGRLLKPGKYYLDATPLMWDPTSPASAGTSSPVTFTVR